ncbi:vWA domain-containing protein [Haliangium ochraceum]|uniref:Aerotolerance regulator N-terminal domain-containing protein n=1 Tax=Haliangium ochraceum (strain DSM 14365 / JCM 11303 / SMP-2) TaxID=502025 RepID=D0LSI0_HALO1|nr:BatA and WFA domain-containing protein [Haliangium ochraceum]ACY15679.1 conserved hypothetical protein [Haliangium ochraceum DSM 14365]
MEFLAPLMLLGALGVAVPVIIHLTGRQRAKPVRFAAFDFLMGERRETARRHRVRQLALLIVRALICLSIPLVLAKPFATCTARGPEVTRGPQAAVIVIDDSFATGFEIAGETLSERARAHARAILEELGPEADVAILRAAEDAPAASELSRDHIRLRSAIAAIRPSARPPDTGTALRRAGQLLAASNHERRTVYLVSLLAESGFQGGSAPPWPPATGPALVTVPLLDAEAGELGDNLAITDVSVERDPASGSRGVRVLVEIENFGGAPVQGRSISLRIEDQEVARGEFAVGPRQRTVKQFLAALPTGSRFADVTVELAPDALAADDRRYARVELREEVRVLLVNGDPHTVRYEDELFYLDAALRPGDRADSGAALTSVTVDDLSEIDFADYDVMILANVRALRREIVAAISAWVVGGGGLLVGVGDNVEAGAYARTMEPLLPQKLRTPLDASYGSRGAERDERALRLTKWEAEHTIFAVFSGDAPGLREARFDRVFLLGPTTQVEERRVLARYTNGAAALVEGRIGDGRVILFTSSLDRDWNDLVIHPGFLPLMQRSVRYLARKQDANRHAGVLVGRTAVVPITAADTRVEIRGPAATRVILEGERLADRTAVRVNETGYAGFYEVWARDASDGIRHRPESDFAVNVDTRGSDLGMVPAERLPTGGQAELRAPAEHERRVELWHAIAAGLLLLLIAESLLVLR